MDWFRLTKFYRGMPELDRYTDQECRRFVARAVQRRGDAIWIVPSACAFAAAGVWIAAGMGIFSAAASFLASSARGNPTAPQQWGGNPNSIVSSSTIFSLGSASASPGAELKWGLTLVFALFVFVGTYILIRRLMLVRSIRNIVNRAGCPYCGFSLVGLTVTGGSVQCPECGQRVWLHEQRLTPDDLRPDTPGAQASRKVAELGAGPLGAYKGVRPKDRAKAGRAGRK